MGEFVKWGVCGVWFNDIILGIIVILLVFDEFNGIWGDFYKNMFVKSLVGWFGIVDEVVDVVEFLMSDWV